MGRAMPIKEVKIRGKMQYPRTDVDRANVSEDDKLCGWWSCCAADTSEVVEGAMRENRAQRVALPKAARP